MCVARALIHPQRRDKMKAGNAWSLMLPPNFIQFKAIGYKLDFQGRDQRTSTSNRSP
jgi:hypothetical protein